MTPFRDIIGNNGVPPTYRLADLPLCIRGYHKVILQRFYPMILLLSGHRRDIGFTDSIHRIDETRNCAGIRDFGLFSKFVISSATL